MSRSITFTAKYRNGKQETRGTYNGINAEYYKSLIPLVNIEGAIKDLFRAIGDKAIYDTIKVYINVSGGDIDRNMATPEITLSVSPGALLCKPYAVELITTLGGLVNGLYKPEKL